MTNREFAQSATSSVDDLENIAAVEALLDARDALVLSYASDLAAVRLELGRTQKHLEQSEVALDDARELLIRAKHQSKASEAFCDDVGTFLAKGTILHPIIDSIRARAQDAEAEVASLQRDLAALRAELAEAKRRAGQHPANCKPDDCGKCRRDATIAALRAELAAATAERDEAIRNFTEASAKNHAECLTKAEGLAMGELVAGLHVEVKRLETVLRKIAEHDCDVVHAMLGRCAAAGLKALCPSCRAREALAK